MVSMGYNFAKGYARRALWGVPIMQNMGVGPRIREHREKAGLTQAQLAEAVFATRQTVGNWERGVTLPDIHSLQLLADVFGTTVDELLGGDAKELARAAADDRRSLLRSFVIDVACVAVLIALALVRVGLRDRVGTEASYQGCNLVLLVIQFVAMAYMWKATFSRDRVLRARNLMAATDVVAFLEGRASSDELPRDWLYRWVLVKWDWWRYGVAAALAIAAVVLVASATIASA